jgi:DNA/RNA-binding domain of Phe-tRNA-synthetase-like protein
LVEAGSVTIGPSRPEYLAEIRQDTRLMTDADFHLPDPLQKGIRSLLKAYGFHPSGRNRPASEFLVKDMQLRGDFNPINNVVDINNHLSLLTHLPISILDLDKTGRHICIRVGMEGESYVFNREGHELSLKNLLVIAGAEQEFPPFGSPVKDSQATKILPETKNLVAIVYTSKNITLTEELEMLLEKFAQLLKREAGAGEVSWAILDSTP